MLSRREGWGFPRLPDIADGRDRRGRFLSPPPPPFPRRRVALLSGSGGRWTMDETWLERWTSKGFLGGVERRNSSDPGVPDVPLIDQSAQGDRALRNAQSSCAEKILAA